MVPIDLHIHSNHSLDGEWTPDRIAAMAKEQGIGTIAIADHNRVSGVEPAAAACKRLGISLIPAIEIDCAFRGIDIHLLGYYIDPGDSRFRDLDENMMEKERAACAARVAGVRGLGLIIDETELQRLAPGGIATGEILAEIALEDKRNRKAPLLDPYRPGGERSDNPPVNFYWDYCSRGKPAFSEVVSMPLSEAVALVTTTGGVPIIAHPGVNLRHNEDLLSEILAEGVAGVEVYCSYHQPETAARWRTAVARDGGIFTCGSDFHGKTKPSVRLGGHGGDGGEREVLESLASRAGR